MEINTISQKKVSLIILLGSTLIYVICMVLAVWMNDDVFIILMLVAIMLFVYFVINNPTKTKTIIGTENDEYLEINQEKIYYKDIAGIAHYENPIGSMLSFIIRLDSDKLIQFNSTKKGKDGMAFLEVERLLTHKIEKKNPSVKRLTFYDIGRNRNINYKPLLMVFAGIIILVNLVAIYDLITADLNLPWRIFYVNLVLLYIIPYIRRIK